MNIRDPLCKYGLKLKFSRTPLLRTPNRGPEGVRYNGELTVFGGLKAFTGFINRRYSNKGYFRHSCLF